jgi:hypothetical protein
MAAAIMLTFMTYGCAATDKTAQTAGPQVKTEQKQAAKVYKGAVVGKSNKAKTISIKVGKGDAAKTMMVKFDDNTKGLEFARKGEAAIITWEHRGSDQYATEIKPKLAKLPEGVPEIKVDEMHALINSATPMTLVDARPTSRYNQAHLPGAISIPVPKLKKMKTEVLPDDKDKLLVFYCGGPT